MCSYSNLSIDQSVAGANIPAVTFIVPAGLTTRELAHMLAAAGTQQKTMNVGCQSPA